MITDSVRSIAAAILLAITVDAGAQTCAVPRPLAPNTIVEGATCGVPKIADTFCDGTPNPGPNIVYRLTLEQPSDVELMIGTTSPPFEPTVYLSDAACSSGRCVSALEPVQTLPAGDYWIIVGASEVSSDGACGAYTLANFVSPANTIFSGSFD